MKQLKQFWQHNSRTFLSVVAAFIILCLLLIYKLGSLVHGLSSGEVQTSVAAVGWHGIYHSPLDLPLKIVRSIVFYIFPKHGQTLTRLPNVVFGGLSIISFGWLAWLWHGKRTALMATALFASSAWVLHVSRLASFDVMYLWAITTLLLTHVLLSRYTKHVYVWYVVLAIWGLLITIPGVIWFVLPEIYLQRAILKKGWKLFGHWWQRILSVIVPLFCLPLLIIDFTRSGQLLSWLGFPSHLAGPATLLKQFVGVFVHLFIRGPEYATVWLGRSVVLDAFTLAMAALGIYFYGRNWRSSRSRLLEVLLVIGVILVTLNGPVSFSVLVPIMYVASAMGIAYLLHEWLQVFPLNPLARRLGIGLVAVAVGVSCLYNLRAYFIAWPHNPTAQATFRYHL